MTKRLAHVCALALAVLPAFGEEGRPARVYTNEDLERVAPLRGETGVLSRPGTPPAGKATARKPAERGAAARGEAYWRSQASRVREKVRTIREQASRIREQIEREAERATKGKGRRGRLRAPWAEDNRARRLREIEARSREVESEFEDRARREGALPGWLR